MYGRQQQRASAGEAQDWSRLLSGVENRDPNLTMSSALAARSLTSRRVTAFPSPDAFSALMKAQQPSSSSSSSSSLSASSSSHSGRKRRAVTAAGGRQKQQRSGEGGEQLYLDLGQALLGLTVCAECGCGFNRGQPEDERQHRRQHERVTLGLAFTVSSQQQPQHHCTRRVCADARGLSALCVQGWKEEPVLDGRLRCLPPLPAGQRLLCIRSSHLKRHPSHADKVREVLQQQSEQLGTAVDGSLRLLAAAEPQGCSAALLLYIAERRVVASLLVKSPVSASRLLQSADGSWLLSSSPSDSVTAAVGVEAVWVLKRCRRQGLATRLLDACRACLLYGLSISRQEMAFSQPTDDGRRLAQRYADRSDVLAYRA